MADIFLGYHKTHVHGEFTGETFSTDTKISPGSTLIVVSGNKAKSTDKVTYYLEGKYQILGQRGKVDSRFENKENSYSLKKIASTPKLLNLNNEKRFDSENFHKNFTSGQSVKRIAGSQIYLIKLFDDLLCSDGDADALDLIDDFSDIDNEETGIDGTERLESKLARIGQGVFRKNTIDAWGGMEKCAVTGLQIPALLNASHIVPWRDCKTGTERKSGSNGVMLCVHLDRLFDRFLIGFQKTSQPDVRALIFSPKIQDKSSLLREVGIDHAMRLDLTMVKFSVKHLLEQNLDKHLARVLEQG